MVKSNFFTTITVMLIASNLLAQTPEQYKNWETASLKMVSTFEEQNEKGLSEGDLATIDNYYLKLVSAIEKDPNNPLLLKRAGDVKTYMMKSGMPAKDEVSFYMLKAGTSNEEDKVLIDAMIEHFEKLNKHSLEAERYYESAASQNESEAIMALVQFYRDGYFRFRMANSIKYPFNINKVDDESVVLLQKAQKLGNENASLMLAQILIQGEDKIKQDRTRADQILRSTSQPAEAYLALAASFLDPNREVKSAREYFSGVNNGLYCLDKSLALGNKDAAYYAGEVYIGKYDAGSYEWKEYDKAFTCFKQAVVNETKTPLAYYQLAECYLKGRGVKQDINKGVEMMEKLLSVADERLDKAAIRETIKNAKKG